MNAALTTLASAVAAFIFGATLVVSARYYIRWRDGYGHLLPLHVWTVAISYDLMLISVIFRIGNMPPWAQALNSLALGFGFVAMAALLRATSEAS